MKNRLGTALALGLVAAIGATQGVGCAYPPSMIFIDGVLDTDSACGAVASPSSGQTSYGTIDAAYLSEYVAALLIGNQMVARGSDKQLKPETSRVQIYGGDIRITDGGTTEYGAYFDYFSTTVDPGSGNTPGYSGAYARLLDASTMNAIASSMAAGGIVQQVVVSEVTLYGRTLGGDEVRGAPWTFPIYVCLGCLCTEPSDDTCVGSENTPDPVCRIGQDYSFDCRLLNAPCL